MGKHQNRNDREDARGLARLLYRNELAPVYHGEHGLRTLRELARTYLAITRDLTRVMTRIKAIYRSWGIACAGQLVATFRFADFPGFDTENRNAVTLLISSV